MLVTTKNKTLVLLLVFTYASVMSYMYDYSIICDYKSVDMVCYL